MPVIAHHRRRILLGSLAVALPLTSVSLLGAPAQARTPKPPPYTGPASGTVTCDRPNIKVTFAPPLTYADTGTTTVTLKGTLKDCTVNNTADVITLGKITGSFTTSGGCQGLALGTVSPVTFTVQWKGKHNNGKTTYDPSVGTVDGAGPAYAPVTNFVGFVLPNPVQGPDTGTITGSFPGSVTDHSFAYGTQDVLTVLALCSTRPGPHGTQKPAKGLKKMNIKTGEIKIP